VNVDASDAMMSRTHVRQVVGLDYYLRSPLSGVAHLAIDDAALSDLSLQILAGIDCDRRRCGDVTDHAQTHSRRRQ
jgi:hypothetical protein